MFILKELPFSLYSNVSQKVHIVLSCHCAFKMNIASFGYDLLPFPQIEIFSSKSAQMLPQSLKGLHKCSSTSPHSALFPC